MYHIKGDFYVIYLAMKTILNNLSEHVDVSILVNKPCRVPLVLVSMSAEETPYTISYKYSFVTL